MHIQRFGFTVIALFTSAALSFPSSYYESLAGRSPEEVDQFIRSNQHAYKGASPPPPPVKDTKSKLVNDWLHPFVAPKSTDQRGPCPGLNTLANHGYINRNGVDTPQNIVNAVQKGFNMEYSLAVLVTWGAFIVDGNHLTNLMSIGGKTSVTGPFPPAPAIVGGLSTHAVFEGDASTTRGDAYFGDNHSFNETLFDQLNATAQQYGGGYYNFTTASEFRWLRIQDSLARNPTFDFTTPRYFTAYAESVFPLRFFVDGRQSQENPKLDLNSMRLFFETNRMPKDFHRREGQFGDVGDDFGAVVGQHLIQPGQNVAPGQYVLDPEDGGFSDSCRIFEKQVGKVLVGLYPPANTTGALREALRKNLHVFYSATGFNCTETFPYGKA